MQGKMTEWRQDLHKIPEIGLQEFETSKYIKNKLSEPSQIKKFNVDGYYFEPQESTKNEWLFLRDSDTA